jgi:D-3-phosphoglycerate dehydrogenase
VAKPDRPSETLDRADAIGISFVDDLDTLAETCDVLSFHVPSTGGTTKLVGRELLARVQPGTIVLNTSRAAIVDEEALIEAMDAKGVRAGLDVLSGEPGQGTGVVESRLARHPNVYGTHHIGASTEQAQEAIAAETVRIVRTYKDTGRVPNVVNLARSTPATHMLVVRHRDRPGVLAHVFDHLREANLNVQETENIVFEGAEAAVARINLDGKPSPALCGRVKSENADILDLQVVQL